MPLLFSVPAVSSVMKHTAQTARPGRLLRRPWAYPR